MKARKHQPILLATRIALSSALAFLFAALLHSCGTVKPWYDKNYKNWESYKLPDTVKLKYSVYLIGDAGEQKGKKMEPALKLLRNMIYEKIDTVLSSKYDTVRQMVCYDTSFTCHSTASNNTVVFLGDNIYHHGLPAEGDKDRKDMEKRIDAQLNIVKDFKGNVYFVPGNHDWNQSKKGGLAAVNRQEEYIEKVLPHANPFLPSNGCPGPVERQITNDLTMIFIDSEWFIYPHQEEKPVGTENGCNVNDKVDFIMQLADMIDKNKNKNIIICQHHPLYTNGNHGGHYSIKDYFFPLTLVRPNLYIPLPGIGSIYPLMRKYGISQEDISHPSYRQLRDAMLNVLENKKNIVLAAGHEHNLQYRKDGDVHHVLSGSGCKDKYAIKGNGAHFVHDHEGFARINYYDNQQAWLEMWEPEGDGTTGKVTFRAPLYSLITETSKLPKDFDCKDSVITLAAAKEFKATGFRKLMFGEHYRAEWGTPVRAHVLDFKCEKGGLTPYAKGGGQQTISIRLLSKDSVDYQLRTVSKDPSVLIPIGLRKTFADDILQDQMSSGHPYGALTIPPMANAAGVLHANPELFYVPHSPELGNYIDDVGGRLAILEERADGDLSKMKSFGGSKNVVSVKTMYKNIMKDNHNKIDQKFFLKARLFDMFVGDWDRHDDNWRWGEFKKGKNTVYKAVPRDRDQVYVKFDGIFPFIFRKLAVRNFNHFTAEFYDMKGLNKSGSLLDKTLINEPSLSDWMAIADSLKRSLTDSVIDAGMKRLPPEIYALSGKEIGDKLKSRRDQLDKAAIDYYRILSKSVEVIGSDMRERFEVNRMSENEAKVTIYGLDDNNAFTRKIYERTFKEGETKQVILYGLDGDDEFILRGKGGKGPGIKLIGGKGKDSYIDSTEVTGRKRKTRILDYIKEDNLIAKTGDPKTHLAKNKKSVEYESYKDLAFKRNSLAPRLFAEYNNDFGFFTGAGIVLKTYNFGKPPASSEHSVNFHYAGATGGKIVSYKGIQNSFPSKNQTMQVYYRYSDPDNILNYFGTGNETKWDEKNIDPYRLNIEQHYANIILSKKLTSFMSVGIGPQFINTTVFKGKNIIVDGPERFRSSIKGPQNIIGARLNGLINLLDDQKDPKRGVKVTLRNDFNQMLEDEESFYTRHSGDVTFFLTPRGSTAPFTVALRTGASINSGVFPFYESAFLGGTENLRGYRYSRFAGRSMAYQNVDLRFRLFEFRNYVFTGKWGLMGFADAGRVFARREISQKWHVGYGPGMWINLYNLFMLSGSVGFSEEGKFISINSGFFF